jgi:hypothetical protein
MLTQSIHIHVRKEFTIPNVYLSGSTEEIEEALWIGSFIQQSLQTRRANDEVKAISQIKDEEISRIQAQYNDKLTRLLDELRNASLEKDKVSAEYADALKESRKTEREQVCREWEEKMRALRNEHDILTSRYNGLEARRKDIEDSRSRDISDAIRRTEELMEKVVAAKQDQLSQMEGAYTKLQSVIEKQTDEISKLSMNINKRGANVKNKGSDYEEEFREKLMRSFGLCRGFKLRDTRLGMGHEMDFSMEMEGNVVLWELKNYGNIVPKAEVDKFLRDLKENPQAKIGVMISRATDIYGKNYSGPLLTEFDDGKMMIYISKFEEFCGSDENRVFQMITSLFRIWWEYGREESNTLDRAEMIRDLERIIEDISKRRTDWRRHKAHLDELSRWTSDLLDESESRLDRILKRVRQISEKECEIEIPEGVFRDSDGEREQLWINSIMKVCQPGGQIEVRELVELLTTHHKLSKDTIRSNVMSIIKDSAVAKKGVIKYINGITKRVEECKIVF